MDETHDSDRLGSFPPPRETGRLFGHAEAEREMLEAFRSKRLPQAWLIGGPRGIGKATLVWRFVRFLMAYPDPEDAAVRAAPTLDIPETHPVWARLRSGALADVAVLRRQWNDKSKKLFGDIRVDDVRAALQLFQRAAGAGGYRICVIDSADDLNRSSANALLKAIEDPPPRSVFLIVAHRPAQVMPTILSRCRKLILPPLDPEMVMGALDALGPRERAIAPSDLASAIARSGGSVGGTLRLLDEARLVLDRELRIELDRLPDLDWRALHRAADHLGAIDSATSIEILVETVLTWLDQRVRAAAQAGTPPGRLAPLAEVWEKVHAAARETDALNLDKRPLLLSIFADLAQATRGVGRT